MNLHFNNKKLAQVAKANDLAFVILHGSYASGRARPESDVDIAVLGNRVLSFERFSRLYGEFGEVFGDQPNRELDLKTLHGTDPFFRYEVVQDGKLLYGDAAAYEEFKASAYNAYEDAEPLFDLEQTLVKKYQRYLNRLIARYA